MVAFNQPDFGYVVRNRAGQIVVMFWGDPSITEAEASDWAQRRGYTVHKALVSQEFVEAETDIMALPEKGVGHLQ